jgi:outer membrane immunogenic protein
VVRGLFSVGGTMRQIITALLSATALSIAGGLTAFAADMPVKAAPPAPVAVYDWGGLYVGGNIGYGWGSSDPNLTFVDTNLVGFGGYFAAGGNVTPNVKPTGVIGGVQIGYNWMVSPHWVLGLVTDFQGSDVKASGTNSFTPGNVFTPSAQSNSVQTDWFGTARAKLGFAQNNWLLYGTGGLAYAHVKTSGALTFQLPPFVSFTGSDSTIKAGWAIGGGLDYGVTRNWTVGVEYLYMDLGRVSYTEANAVFAPASVTISNRAVMNIVRLTANYKF